MLSDTHWLHVKYSRTRRLLTSLSWTIMKAECQRIDVFELWCWRRLLGAPRTARRSSQSILKQISPDYSLEGLMLKLQYLATWCKEMTHWKRPWSCEDWRQKEKRATEGDLGWIHYQLNRHEFEQTLGGNKGQAKLACYSPQGYKESDTT